MNHNSTQSSKFRREPVLVLAEQFKLDALWPEGVHELNRHWTSKDNVRRFRFYGEGPISIFPGDWVVANPTGERYVVRNQVFDSMYEKVS